MSKRKVLFLTLIIGGLGLIVWLVISGSISSSSQKAPSNDVVTSNIDAPSRDVQSLVEGATGIKTEGETYVPTAEDIKDWVKPLIEFDPKVQTYEEWQQYAKDNIAFSAQDFTEDSIVGITPSPQDWDGGYKREFIPMAASQQGEPFAGQGGAKIYTWLIGGDQTLYSPKGKALVGSYSDVNVAVQCAGSTADTCRILSYDSIYPLYFDEELALTAP